MQKQTNQTALSELLNKSTCFMKYLTNNSPLSTLRSLRSKPLLVALFVLFGVTTVHAQTKSPPTSPPRAAAVSTEHGRQLSYEIIPAPQNSYGYNIMSGNKKLVHQPNVPGLPGNRGFKNKTDAEKCASLVIKKINNNIMPPTVTRQELDSLHIKL